MDTAENIIKQLGGSGRLSAMIGAHGFRATENDVTFNFKGSKETNCMTISLNEADLYDINFYKIKGAGFFVASTASDIPVENLKSVIESKTKLSLSL